MCRCKTMHKYKIWHGAFARALRHKLHPLDNGKPAPQRVCLHWVARDRHNVYLQQQDPFSRWTGFPQKAAAHLHSVQLLGLRIPTVADVQQTENGLVPYPIQQPFGEIADMVLPEVPHGQDPRRDAGPRIGVAAVAEILAQVFAVPEPLHKLCGAHRWWAPISGRTLKTYLGGPTSNFMQGSMLIADYMLLTPYSTSQQLGKRWQGLEALNHDHSCVLLLWNRCQKNRTFPTYCWIWKMGRCKLQWDLGSAILQEFRLGLSLAGD